MKRRDFLAAGQAAALLPGMALAQPANGPAGVPLIPVETMFRRSAYRSITLSPNGKLFAATVALNNRQNLVVVDLEQK
jgi:hypothetical protein